MIDLLMIVGPTAVGKTKLSIELAKKFNGEIINSDSMQFYRGLDIGTAKVKQSETSGVKHHLLDILEPTEEFSVAEYQSLVRTKIEEIKKNNKLPIVVGGSGLYLSSIIYDYKFFGDKRNDELVEEYNELPLEQLAKILIETKPKLAAKCDLSNRRRVLRALEKNEDQIQDTVYPYYESAVIIGLKTERSLLYQMIDKRVEGMLKAGLIQEVRLLFDSGVNSQCIKAIGYKELYQYFLGEITLEDAIALIKRNSRRYAKRQITWFKNKMNVNWFETDFNDFDITVNEVIESIKKEVNS